MCVCVCVCARARACVPQTKEALHCTCVVAMASPEHPDLLLYLWLPAKGCPYAYKADEISVPTIGM